jgi:hypothetical protein
VAGQEIATVLDLVEVTTGVVLVHSVVAMTMADFVDLEPEIVAVIMEKTQKKHKGLKTKQKHT